MPYQQHHHQPSSYHHWHCHCCIESSVYVQLTNLTCCRKTPFWHTFDPCYDSSMDVCWGLWLMRSTLDHFCHCNLVPGPIPISHAINYNTLWYLVTIMIHFDPSLFFLVWLCVEYIVVFQSIDAWVSAAKRVVRSLDPFCDVYVWCAWNWSYNRTDVTRGIVSQCHK